MGIQWFPGHMTKASRQVEEKLKLVDVVFELLDARLPWSSRNPMLEEQTKSKKRVVLLTKYDLADEAANRQWMRYFQEQGIPALQVDAKTGAGVDKIPSLCEKVLQPLFEKREKKGIVSRKFRALVVGIPNVGKSSLINRLAKRSATATGNRPGVTKAQQWIRVGKDFELLDTPGILWPKFDDERTGFILAASGAIKDEILPLEEVALYVVKLLTRYYPSYLIERYRLSEDQLMLPPLEQMEEIGRKRGCRQRGGEVDLKRAADLILADVRLGRLGRLTFEWPEDIDQVNTGNKETEEGST